MCAQGQNIFLLKWTILDSPVSCVYCVHPGREQASVAYSGWGGLMIWAASRRGEKSLVCFCEHKSFAYSMNRIKDSVMSCSPPHEYAASNALLALRVHLGPGCTTVFSLLLAPYPGFSLHLWPLQNKPLLICLKVLKATGNGEEKINRQSTKTAEERDKTTLGQRRKEMKLGICPVCAWLDLCSRFIYFIWGEKGGSSGRHVDM